MAWRGATPGWGWPRGPKPDPSGAPFQRRIRPLLCAFTFTAIMACVGAAPLSAQVAPATAPTDRPPLDVSPGGAFLRAIAFPGWGHVAIGAHTRGAFYFGAQSAVAYTGLRARTRVGEAQDRLRLRETLVRAQLATEGITDPAEVEEAVLSDPGIIELSSLLDSRKGQQEDMIALAIFFVLLSGADAYVSAHLARFPDPLEVTAEPTAGGALELALRVTLPN